MLLSENLYKGNSILNLKDLMAIPLLAAPADYVKQPEHDIPAIKTVAPQAAQIAGADFVKVEKNLISLGFFTPSSKRIKSVKFKTITLTKISPEGDKIEATATIVPAAIYGLPITADQDKWFALQRIINGLKQETGEVHNPVTFTSSELIKLLGQGDAGKNYQEVSDWLDLMSNTGIISEGAVYLAGRRNWARDRFRVFDRAVSIGKQLDDGSIADRNYVWLSDWQLENINLNYLLPIDYDSYSRLRNHIAKALAPLLQVWLYATKSKGSFEKRYDDLCQILSVRQYQHLSKIKEKLGPSLNELRNAGYLAAWTVEKTADRKAHKIVFYHGDKFHRDRQARKLNRHSLKPVAAKRTRSELTGDPADSLLAELVRRGISDSQADKILVAAADDQYIIDQLEWGDQLIAQAPAGKFYNPPGLYIQLIKDNVTPPPTFESSRKRKLRLEAEQAESNDQQERARLQLAYEEYKRREIDNYIADNYDEYKRYAESKKQEFLDKHKSMSLWDENTLARLAETSARAEIAKRTPLDTFEAFSREPIRSIPSPADQRDLTDDEFLTV
jgi:replication initiator protein A